MAVTFRARSGTRLTGDVRFWQPGKTELVDTTGSTARLELRACNGTKRVLLETEADDATNTLTTVEPGHWTFLFSGSITRRLPPTTQFEIELVNDTDADDVITILSGVIRTNPQGTRQ
jgi:hypothetical protein